MRAVGATGAASTAMGSVSVIASHTSGSPIPPAATGVRAAVTTGYYMAGTTRNHLLGYAPFAPGSL
jgi:hypothetical protein